MSAKNHTSAVQGMSVAEMRKCLSEVREFLSTQNEAEPFNMNYELSNKMPVWKFVHLVATGLHKKRTNTRRVDTNIK
jgi:hypothetical protein